MRLRGCVHLCDYVCVSACMLNVFCFWRGWPCLYILNVCVCVGACMFVNVCACMVTVLCLFVYLAMFLL